MSNTENADERYKITTQTRHETVILIESREYQISGVNLRKLNDLSFSLKLTHNGRFIILDVNLKRPRSKSNFINEATDVLLIAEDIIKDDIYLLMEIIIGMQKETISKIESEMDGEKKEFHINEKEVLWAKEYLSKKDVLFDELLSDLESLGYVGDVLGKKVLYLAGTSRKLKTPLSVLSVGNSSAGKSYAQQVIASLFPDDEMERTNRLTTNAISHYGKFDLQNTILSVDEIGGAGAGSDQGLYQLRTMLSEGKFVLNFVRTDPLTGQHRTIRKEIFGPISFLSTTTHLELVDDETKNRILILKLDESSEQNNLIFEAILSSFTEGMGVSSNKIKKIQRKYKLIQKVLEPIEVEIPQKLRSQLQFAYKKPVFKRMYKSYLSLIQTIAFHRQYQKKIHTGKRDGIDYHYILVDEKDIFDTNLIMKELGGGVSSDISPVNRQMLEIIYNYCKERASKTSLSISDVRWTRRDIREYCGWEHKPVDRAVRSLVEMEYIERIHGGERSIHHYSFNVDETDLKMFDISLWSPSLQQEKNNMYKNDQTGFVEQVKSQNIETDDLDDSIFDTTTLLSNEEFIASYDREEQIN